MNPAIHNGAKLALRSVGLRFEDCKLMHGINNNSNKINIINI